jgi:hypothetical protein
MNFEVGQKVYDSFRFAGCVGTVRDVSEKYYTVAWDDDNESVYHSDRKYSQMDAFPTLYPFPYEIEVKEVSQFSEGEIILHRNNEAHPWNIGIYLNKVGPNHSIKAFGQAQGYAKFIIPFKNNESKLWKTN